MENNLRHISAILLLLCVGAGSAAATDESADHARLREIKEVLWPKAYREQDSALLDQILANEFESIDAEGARSTKAEELDYIRKNKPSYDSFRFEIKRLQIFPNRTAVVSGTGHVVTQPKAGKKGSRTEYQSSNVFIERDRRWQAIASHVSGVKTTEL